MSRAEVGYRHVCGQRRRAWHTRGRGHGNRHTRGRRGGARHTCKRRYRNCPSCGRRPGPGSAALFRGGTICWAEPVPACRKKKGPGKAVSQNSVLRSPQAAIHRSFPKSIHCGEGGRNRNSVIFGDMRLENDIFLPVRACGVFPTRPERPPPALFRCGLTRHVGRLLHRQSNPAWRAIPPEGREASFSTDKAPGSQKGPGGRVISLFYSRAAGEITPRSAGSPRTPCSRGDT